MEITSDAHQTASHGGQASLGLFGILGTCPGLVAPPPYIRGAVVQKENPRLRPSRIRGVLNSFDRAGLSDARARHSAAPVAKPVTVVVRPSLDDEPELAHSQWLADVAATYGCMYDEEAAAYARSFAGAGMTEHLMAMEG